MKARTAMPPTTPPAMAPELVLCPVEAVEVSAAAVAEAAKFSVEVEAIEVNEDKYADVDGWPTAEVGEVNVDFVVLEEDDVVWLDDDPLARNGAAILGFEERNPAVRSPGGQPWLQGFDLQHPINGGVVPVHVYHRLPVGHC